MGTYSSFAEMPVWNEAVDFAAEIYRLCLVESIKSDFRMKDQLKAATASVASNIAEGFEYGDRKNFIRFLYYSKGSTGEVYTQLTILYKAGIIDEINYQKFSEKIKNLSKKIGGLIRYLKSQKTFIKE